MIKNVYFCRNICHMQQDVLNSFSLSNVKGLLQPDKIISLGDDFTLAYQSKMADYEMITYPCRINGYLAVFCKRGNFRCSINLTDYEISDGMLVLSIPENIIRLEPIKDSVAQNGIELVIIAVSPKFMSDLKFDLNKLWKDALEVLKNPCMKLLPADIDIASQYLHLIDDVHATNTRYLKESISYLISSIFYLFGSIVDRSVILEKESRRSTESTRHKQLFEQFIALVTEYHYSERTVRFYADKLCITPKYLSKIIKKVSNLSAPEWINKYVILEIKQMLRHSSLSAKEIAYKLNFPNTSFFFKYFKLHTGLTPREYREM